MTLILQSKWMPIFSQEWWMPLLAESEFVVQRALDAVTKSGTEFGNANDSIRFGIILFVLLGVLGYLAYLYIKDKTKQIDSLCERLRKCDETLDLERKACQARLDQERSEHTKALEVHFSLVKHTIDEFNRAESDRKSCLKDILEQTLANHDLMFRWIRINSPNMEIKAGNMRRIPRRTQEEIE